MLVCMGDQEAVTSELALLRELEATIRHELYSIESAGRRATAVTALAAAAAERAHRRSDGLPDWTNETSDLWQRTLADVWAFLEGDSRRHRVLSNAIAEFLTSPSNHNEGQDGPDDFDRPQTIASYSAAASAIFWGVDFATTAVGQLFELIDLQFDGSMTELRAREIEHERAWALDACGRVVRAAASTSALTDRRLLAALRQ